MGVRTGARTGEPSHWLSRLLAPATYHELPIHAWRDSSALRKPLLHSQVGGSSSSYSVGPTQYMFERKQKKAFCWHSVRAIRAGSWGAMLTNQFSGMGDTYGCPCSSQREPRAVEFLLLRPA